MDARIFSSALALIFVVIMVTRLVDVSGRLGGPRSSHHYLGSSSSNAWRWFQRVALRRPDNVITSPPTVFKGATLRLEGGRAGFKALSHDVTYEVESQARCHGRLVEPGHMASCTCGFYSYADRDRARAHDQLGRHAAVLTAVASGDILGYQLGYRSSHQRVTSVALRVCSLGSCENPAAVLMHLWRVSATLHPACKSCAKASRAASDGDLYRLKRDFDYVTLDEFSALLSAQVPTRKRIEVLPGPGATALTRADLTRVHQPALHALERTKTTARSMATSSAAQNAVALGRLGAAVLRRGLHR